MKPLVPSTPWALQSAMPGSRWPVVLPPGPATAVAVLHQLEQTQWLPAESLLTCQLQQLEVLLQHAWATVPWCQQQWVDRFEPGAPLTYERFRRLPLLSRQALQTGYEDLKSADSPKLHGPPVEGRTSGSTGAPVRFLTTPFMTLYWNIFTLRDHLWHRRDLGQKLAIIRHESPKGRADNWGPATAGVVATGPAVSHSIRTEAAELLDWLDAERPGYLFSYPSLVADLARLSIEGRVQLPGLLQVRTLAESLAPEVRELCRQAWGVPLVDLYSSSEAGYMALQCPEHEHYHVQSEGVLLEVLDDQGEPCGPGQVGRVVVTALHNFAMPLVRYDIGDYAEVGGPCPCGRGLPVLKRVLGRVRNTLVTADGKRYWPLFGTRLLADQVPLRQHQFVQKTTELVEARLVVDRPLTEAEEALVVARIRSQLPAGMQVQVTYRERLERSASGKFEDFVSEVSAGPKRPVRNGRSK